MRTLPWRRLDRIADVRSQIWQYLSPAVAREQDVLLEAGRLLQMPDEDAASLGRVHFLLSDELGELLSELPLLLRGLSTRTEEEEEWSAERVRGAIRWGRTWSARVATGNPALFVTAPAFRAYRTPENELLVFVLDQVLSISKRTGWLDKGGSSADAIRERHTSASRWRRARVLQMLPAEEPRPRALARIRTGRRRRKYAKLIDTYRLLIALTRHLDRQKLREAVERRALVVADDATLFEVLCTFRLVDILPNYSWKAGPLRLFGGGLHLHATRANERIDLWYQQVPSELSRGSRYRSIQRAHAFKDVGTLRPDVVLRRTSPGGLRWLIVEMKMGGATEGRGRTVDESARAALENLLAYRRDLEDVLGTSSETYGLGIAWGADLVAVDNEIMLATPDRMPEALNGFLA